MFPFEAKHKRYDHGVLSFALPCEDFITSFKVPKRSFDIPTDRVDVVFFQRNLLQWHKNVQQRISPFSSEGGEATGETLLQKMREEQDIMRGEALKLQGRAETSRRRARERRPNRSKDQVRTRRLHATLAVAYSEALIATANSRVTVAARVGLKALGLDHLPEAILRYVQISPNWAYLLRAEVKKVQAQLLKLDEAQLREGKRKRCDAKKYIFDHGIKGVRRVMNKHGTVTGLQQVDHPCPIGLHWEASLLELSRPNIKAEMHEWTSSLPPDKNEVSLTDKYIKISAKFLTDVPALLTVMDDH